MDFESTGLDVNHHRITEAGVIFFESESHSIIASLSHFVYDESYPELSQEIIDITGITTDLLKREGKPFPDFCKELYGLMKAYGLDYFIAHNKSFDEDIFRAELSRHKDQLGPVYNALIKIPWLCSILDVIHPEKFKSKKLSHLALDYGVPVDPAKLHRAADDVLLMVEMFKKAKLNFEDIVARSKIPWVTVRVKIPPPWEDGSVGKTKAQENGYGWEMAKGTQGPSFAKSWVKRIKENELASEQEKMQYPVVIVQHPSEV